MSNGEIIISVVTAILVVFCLIVSVVIPRRDPSFPGRRNLVAFGLICAVLVGGALAAIEVYGAEEGHGAEAAVEGEHSGEAAEGEAAEGEAPAEAPAPAEEPAPAEAPPAAEVDLEAGRTAFVDAGCGNCHALADAGTSGAIGPDLDSASPALERIVDVVTNGAGAMPAFASQLGADEIDLIAEYVAAASSG